MIRVTFGDEKKNIFTMIGDVDNFPECLNDYIDSLQFPIYGYKHYPMKPILCNESDDTLYIIESRQMHCKAGDTRHRIFLSELNNKQNILDSNDGVFNFETSTSKFYRDDAFTDLNDAKDALKEMYDKYSIDTLENYQFRIVEYVIDRVYGFKTEGYQSTHFYLDEKWIEKFI